MPLLLAGIDEAGYGPTLGPLAVGLSVFRLDTPDDSTGTPNLWALLDKGICREPGRAGKSDPRGRVAIADSKQLKLSNSVTTTHPLVHLERGVLAMSSLLHMDPPATDAALLASLGTAPPSHPCYAGPGLVLPIAHGAGEIGIAASIAARAMESARVQLISLRCRLMPEADFNEIVRATGSKAETTGAAVVEHIRHAWSLLRDSPSHTRLGLVCDRQGGRMAYADLLARAIPDAGITVIEQSPERSRYTLEAGPLRAGVAFVVEAEQAHLPVALASMVAKYTRELAMIRFNRHWGEVCLRARGSPLRPTAGYAQDARRWLDEMSDLIRGEERARLVRIA